MSAAADNPSSAAAQVGVICQRRGAPGRGRRRGAGYSWLQEKSHEHDTKTSGTGAQTKTAAKWLKRIGMGFAGLALLAGGAAAFMELRSPRMRAVDASKKVAVTPERVARGRYLVEGVAHCMRCHSDHDWKMHGAPEMAGLSGAGWDVPWRDNKMPGPVFATNLTPDPETGLGNVPDDAIARAIREGVGHDGRALFMMPWQSFRGLSDEEVASMIAYLRSIPAVRKPRGDDQASSRPCAGS